MVVTDLADSAAARQHHGLRQGPAQLLCLVKSVAPTSGRVLVVDNRAGQLLAHLRATGYDKLSDCELPNVAHTDESFDNVILYRVLETSV